MAKNSFKLQFSPSDYPSLVECIYYGRSRIVDYVKDYVFPCKSSASMLDAELDTLSHTACSMARLKLATLASQGVRGDTYDNLFNEGYWVRRASQLALPIPF